MDSHAASRYSRIDFEDEDKFTLFFSSEFETQTNLVVTVQVIPDITRGTDGRSARLR